MSKIANLIFSAAFTCLLFSSCSNVADGNSTSAEELTEEPLSVSSSAQEEQTESSAAERFFTSWEGDKISREEVSRNGCVFYNDSETDNIWAWENFCEQVSFEQSAQVCICTESSALLIDYQPETDDESARFVISEKYTGSESLPKSFTLSGCGISPQLDNGKTTYYIGDVAVLTVSSANTDSCFVPFECEIYQADSGANLSFPYSRVFASYSDFESYYNDYGDELDLPNMQEDMKAYDDEGGFNAHVVFLYGDMEGSDSVVYSVSAVSAGSSGLEIYLKKTVTSEKSNQVGKWQTVVKVPSEYLDNVSPDSIHWVTFEYSEEN